MKVLSDLDLNSPQEAILIEPPSSSETPAKLSFLDVLLALAERKWLILMMTAGGALLMGALSSLFPLMYTATTTIVPPQQQQSSASALLGQLAPFAAGTGGSLGIKTPADLYVAILGGL